MDLITPARTWAIAPPAPVEPAAHSHRMPPMQQVVMFCSVVGPVVGLLVAITLLWHGGLTGRIYSIGWPEIIAMLIAYLLTGFAVTIGFHRLLTHRSFETYRPIKLMLAILGSASGQGMCIRWCATHRRHHQNADQEGDPHSPHVHDHGDGPLAMLKGLWHAHVAWCFDADKPNLARSVPDLLADRALVRIDALYFFWVAVGILLPAIALGLVYHSWPGFISGLLWGGIVRICVQQHATWSVNSVCHVWGGRPFQSDDHSTNNLPVAIISLGEGWHNNHHAFPTSARHGLRWYQLDVTWLVIATARKLGLAWDVRTPPEAALAAKRR